MKMMKLVVLIAMIAMIALTLFLILPNLSWAADDGAAIYKAKSTACQGADLGGKPAAKIPSLVSDDAKKTSDVDLTDMIGNGGKDKKAMHTFSNKGVSTRSKWSSDTSGDASARRRRSSLAAFASE